MQIKLIFKWMKIDFAYEKMSSETRFEKEAWGNSEIAYLSKSVSTTTSKSTNFIHSWTQRLSVVLSSNVT